MHGTDKSRALYDELIARWLAHGRQLPNEGAGGQPGRTINEIIAAYWRHAQAYYVKFGEPTGEQTNIKHVMRSLRRLYGSTPVTEFGPMALKAVRQSMIDSGRTRTGINNDVARLKQMFRWAVENELVPPSTAHALSAVRGLRRGRTSARESEKVRPIAERMIVLRMDSARLPRR